MMRIFALMVGSLAAAALAAACDAGDASGLDGYYGGGVGEEEGGGATSNAGAPTPGTEAKPQGTVPPAGPGSANSLARKNFIDNVFGSLTGSCGSCHTAGTSGAPKFWSTDGSNTYQLLDARGMVVGTGSLLISHRHTGAGTEPTPEQIGKIGAWLDIEGRERVGQASNADILSKVGACINAADWKTAENAIRALRTRARNGENAGTCTGCDNEVCMACHNPGYNFATGGVNQTLSSQLVRERPFINKFFGTNGTEPVASGAVKAKADAVATGGPYSHPNFRLTAQAETAINDFVTKTIAAYKAGTCGTPPPPPAH